MKPEAPAIRIRSAAIIVHESEPFERESLRPLSLRLEFLRTQRGVDLGGAHPDIDERDDLIIHRDAQDLTDLFRVVTGNGMGDQSELRRPEDQESDGQARIELIVFTVPDDTVVLFAAEDGDDEGCGMTPLIAPAEHGLQGLEFGRVEDENEPPGLAIRTGRGKP